MLIVGNSATINGGGICCYTSSVSLQNVMITNNTAIDGGGIKCADGSNLSLENVTITSNTASDDGGGIYCSFANPSLQNVTISDNSASDDGGGIWLSYSNTSLINSIMWNDSPQEIYDAGYGSVTATYSDIQGGWTGTGNIDSDPLFINSGIGDYHLQATSPCIDAGDPVFPLDPDGTRADMGAYYHPHEVKTYEFPNDDPPINGWKWLCFDILDITMTGDNNTVDPLLDPIRLDLRRGYGQNVQFYYDDPNWYGGDHEITSPQGYKFQTENECEFDISGFRCDEHTTFPVLAEMPDGNWIGYFLEETQHVYDAFAGYLDNIYKIQAQHWSVEYDNAWPDVPYTLNPGDMVVVWCRDDILNFSWIDDVPREPFNVGEVQYFTYLEESDYIPIYMSLDPEDLPTEIGAFVDGECQGATVVQDTSAQICAYIIGNQGGSLEFEFYYGGREENKVIREYSIYDPETSQTEKGSIKVENNRGSYYVSFKNEPEITPVPARLETSNYPNPFNPVTTIVYSLPKDSKISISIYNIKGQKVKTLVTGTQPAGSYNVTWNGKDESGKDVTSGIYFYKLKTQNNEITRKMLLLK